MKTKQLLAGVGLIVATVLVVRWFDARQKKKIKRVHIANEGYETAEDILYPRRGAMKASRLSF